MQIFRQYSDIPDRHRGSVAAIGNFDGVHRGHLEVIRAAGEHAEREGGRVSVVTFEPHPRQHINPDGAPFRLMNASSKARRLQTLGIDTLFELPFDAGLAGLGAEEFCKQVLAAGLGISRAVVGGDFRFGKGRSGDSDMLRRIGEELEFSTTIVPISGGAEEPYSSTAIRKALSAGKVGEAAHILGHWHRIDGQVGTGQRRGREFGFPTANISLEGLHPPLFGVYASLVEIQDGQHAGAYQGSTSIGVRPTFGTNHPNLEVFIHDFDGDIYGAQISVALVEHQRPELAFSSVEDLVEQMKRDCRISREVLKTHA